MNISWIGSPNYDKNRKPVNTIVIHWMAGNLAGTDAQFQKPNGTSAHYGIEDDKIHQYVKVENVAYHCGVYEVNQRSIGIEHSADPNRPASNLTYDTSAELIATLCKAYNIPVDRKHIIGHKEVKPTQCPGTIDIDKIIAKVIQILNPDNMEDKQLADEMRKLITHNSSYKDAASVLLAIDKLNDAIGQKDQVIDNQNKLVNERNRTITELQGQISTLTIQVTEAQTQYNIAQEQAKKVPALEESNRLLEEQKKKWIDDEQGYLRQITILNKKIEQFKSPIKKLLVQILETLQNK